MTFDFIKPVVVAVLLTGCQMADQQSTTQTNAEPMMEKAQGNTLFAQLADQTLAKDELRFTLHKDGRLIGNDGTMGTWEVRDGKYCRTITVPEKWKGTECQEVKIDGTQYTFISPTGRTNTYTML